MESTPKAALDSPVFLSVGLPPVLAAHPRTSRVSPHPAEEHQWDSPASCGTDVCAPSSAPQPQVLNAVRIPGAKLSQKRCLILSFRNARPAKRRGMRLSPHASAAHQLKQASLC